ncbi:MAG: MBL fold metallo-hydrolase [Bilifractor sp.]
MKIAYGGKTFLVDPMFRPAGKTHELAPTLYPEKGPLADLPCAPEEIVEGIDAVLLTHMHPGHFDQEAADLIPKDLPFYVQNLNDKDLVRKYGMKKTQTIDMTLWTHFDDIRIIRVTGRHGDGPIQHVLNTMQNSSGILLEKDGEKTVFFTGDTVWCSGMLDGLGANPDVIIAYLGYAHGEGMHITMGTDDLQKILDKCPKAKVVCVHMDTFENQELTRDKLRNWASLNGVTDRLIIPENGERFEI